MFLFRENREFVEIWDTDQKSAFITAHGRFFIQMVRGTFEASGNSCKRLVLSPEAQTGFVRPQGKCFITVYFQQEPLPNSNEKNILHIVEN